MITSALIARLRVLGLKVYENVTPKQTTLPAVTVDVTGSFRNRHLGSSNIQTGLTETDFEVSVWGVTSKSVFDTAEVIISAIENFSGPWVDGGSTAHRIAGIQITGESSDFDGQTELHTYSIFLTITHTSG